MLKNTEAEYSKEGCERKLETIGKHLEIAEKKETSSSGPGRCKIQSIKLNLLHIHLLCPFVPFAHFFVFVRVLQFRSHPFPRKHDNSRLNQQTICHTPRIVSIHILLAAFLSIKQEDAPF